MGRQFSFLLALGLLAGAGAFVSIAGWMLFVRDRRSTRQTLAESDANAPVHPTPGDGAATT